MVIVINFVHAVASKIKIKNFRAKKSLLLCLSNICLFMILFAGSPTAASTRHGTNVTGNDATSNLLTDYDYDDDDTTLSSSDEDESY